MKKLLLFTSQYPSKTGDGNFVKNEIQALSQRFDKVYIAKLYNKKEFEKYELPKNVEVVFNGFDGRKDIVRKGVLNRSSILIVFELFFNDISKIKSIVHLKWFFTAILVGRGVYANRKIKQLLWENKNNDMTFYFFWGTGMSYVIPWLVNRFNNKICVKLHRGDLYEYKEGYIPLRRNVLSKANKLIVISNDGKLYLEKLLKKLGLPIDKISLIRLGTRDSYKKLNERKAYKEKLIVSCSGVSDVKRVPLIHKVLLSASKKNKIRWIHFGDGVGMKKLKMEVEEFKSSDLIVDFKGYTINEKILDFYNTYSVDLFINLSSSEGIPVSIMEAISFNIPVLATNAGGTSEIVGRNLRTGVLLPIDVDINQASQLVTGLLTGCYTLNPREYWRCNFDSKNNNKKLVEVLSKK